jgi:hypothetical protein
MWWILFSFPLFYARDGNSPFRLSSFSLSPLVGTINVRYLFLYYYYYYSIAWKVAIRQTRQLKFLLPITSYRINPSVHRQTKEAHEEEINNAGTDTMMAFLS